MHGSMGSLRGCGNGIRSFHRSKERNGKPPINRRIKGNGSAAIECVWHGGQWVPVRSLFSGPPLAWGAPQSIDGAKQTSLAAPLLAWRSPLNYITPRTSTETVSARQAEGPRHNG